MTCRTKSRWDRALRILCAMALCLLGFAHLGPALAAPLPAVEYARYTLPDGSSPDFCQTGIDENGEEKPAPNHVCSACRFLWALLAPPSDAIGELLQGSLSPAWVVTVVHPATQVHFPNSSPRGPPGAVTRL